MEKEDSKVKVKKIIENKIDGENEKSNLFYTIPNCIIDNNGVFKYIQIRLKNLDSKEERIIIRGWKDLEYHRQNFIRFKIKETTGLLNCNFKSIGGGRISIDSDRKKIFVYGYSKSYGRCDHSMTCQILKLNFKNFECTWSNEGY